MLDYEGMSKDLEFYRMEKRLEAQILIKEIQEEISKFNKNLQEKRRKGSMEGIHSSFLNVANSVEKKLGMIEISDLKYLENKKQKIKNHLEKIKTKTQELDKKGGDI